MESYRNYSRFLMRGAQFRADVKEEDLKGDIVGEADGVDENTSNRSKRQAVERSRQDADMRIKVLLYLIHYIHFQTQASLRSLARLEVSMAPSQPLFQSTFISAVWRHKPEINWSEFSNFKICPKNLRAPEEFTPSTRNNQLLHSRRQQEKFWSCPKSNGTRSLPILLVTLIVISMKPEKSFVNISKASAINQITTTMRSCSMQSFLMGKTSSKALS